MKFLLILCLLAQVANTFVLPIKLAAVVNQTEQAEVLTFDKSFWTTTVIIGTPGTAFTVAIDTTSAFLFVPDVSLSGRMNTYNSSKSSTYVSDPVKFNEVTAFGKTAGSVGKDTVILGESFSSNPNRTSVTVPNAFFGTATSLPSNFPSDIDGILGLALPNIAPHGTVPVFQTAITQGDVAIGTYVIWLEDQWATSDNGTHGVIYYGNVDLLHCKADSRHVYPLSHASFFQFTLPSFTSTVKTPFNYYKKTQTVINSISPYIGVPPHLAQSILVQLGLAATTPLPATVPCNTKIQFDFVMALGTESVNELNLILQLADGTCQLAMVVSQPLDNNDDNIFELGIPFLRGRCTYFDYANQKIGFSEPITHGGH